MKVSHKKTSETHVDVEVTLEAAELTAAQEQAVKRLARDVKVSGFRKGKAPADLAAAQIPAEKLAETALDIAVRSSVPAVFEEIKLEPVEHPHLEITKYVPGEMIEYKTSVDVLPEIKLADYHKLKVKKPEVKVGKKEVDEVLAQIADAYAERKVAKKPAALGDEVTIDFTGTKDGKEFEGGKAKDYKLALGSGQFIPGFEEGIVGHEVGDKFDLDLTFPKDYGVKDLAGQKVVFSVLLKQVDEIIKPEFNDEFAAKCGPFKTMDELRADIKQNLTAQDQQRLENQYKDDLVKALVEKSKVAAPEVMINDQYQLIKADVTRNGQSRGLSLDQFIEQSGLTREEWEKEARETATKRVQMMLVLRVLAAEAGIKVEPKEVDEKIAAMTEMYKNDKNAVKQLKTPAVRTDIANRIVVDKTLDYLVAAQEK